MGFGDGQAKHNKAISKDTWVQLLDFSRVSLQCSSCSPASYYQYIFNERVFNTKILFVKHCLVGICLMCTLEVL